MHKDDVQATARQQMLMYKGGGTGKSRILRQAAAVSDYVKSLAVLAAGQQPKLLFFFKVWAAAHTHRPHHKTL